MACQILCDEEEGCRSFSYRADTEVCRLSADAEANLASLQASKFFDHYVKDDRCTTTTTTTTTARRTLCLAQYRGPMVGTRGQNDLIVNSESASFIDCAQLCDQSVTENARACMAFSYDSDLNRCLLFGMNTIELFTDVTLDVDYDHYYIDETCP